MYVSEKLIISFLKYVYSLNIRPLEVQVKEQLVQITSPYSMKQDWNIMKCSKNL